ncbi:MAG: type III-B CRISPR module RAMP protein Cmr4 [bacterium]
MATQKNLLFLYAQSPLHSGAGSSSGVVDLPISRERHTNYPNIPGSALKGVFRHKAWALTQNDKNENLTKAFGPDSDEEKAAAGSLTFTDAKILAFPVRSVKKVFVWVTCPEVLGRLIRDLDMLKQSPFKVPQGISPLTCRITTKSGTTLLADQPNMKLVLDEYLLSAQPAQEAASAAEWLAANALPKGDAFDYFRHKLATDFVVISDEDFRDFVTHSTQIQARIKINYETRTVDKGALFYEEALPPETILYSMVFAEDEAAMQYLKDEVKVEMFQAGGDSTTGRGIIRGRILEGGK